MLIVSNHHKQVIQKLYEKKFKIKIQSHFDFSFFRFRFFFGDLCVPLFGN